MDKREYGTTGEMLSIVGFGGIVVKDTTEDEASQRVAFAIDQGINYFDVAPGYGTAEVCLGPALEPFRKDVFLACKTGKRDKAGAREELDRSLERLRTDHFDLYQLHAMKTWEDFDEATGPNGALETFVEAREKGQVRYLGFSAHSDEVALALMDSFDFDSVLFPLNWVNYLSAGFGPSVVEKATNKGMGKLALKALARGRIPKGGDRPYDRCWYEPVDDPDLAKLALRFTLSQPITAAIPPGDPGLFEMAVKLVQNFSPITEGDIAFLKDQATEVTPLAAEDWLTSAR
ncbi:MAG: aldo/keto reductase [Candidatus Latescibacterota bacterium]|nr:aldo/keto reductase [Candidatus Latescibacterota bacterium]